MRSHKIGLALLTVLMMFPQITETIYSPALLQITHGFHVSPEKAGQTLSLYFFSFAAGIIFWGRMCDVLGRKTTMLGGLLLYSITSLIAFFSAQFSVLLTARMLSAFGAAVGSIGTQTIIRDRFHGEKLVQIFAVIGLALAVSPGIGILTGTVLSQYFGYQGVFAGLALLSMILVSWVWCQLPETMPKNYMNAPLLHTLTIMMKDKGIWCTAILVALFNLNVFSYYQLAVFHFDSLALSSKVFGYSGLLLTLGVGIGALSNKWLIQKNLTSSQLVCIASLLSILGSILLTALLICHNPFFVAPMLLIMMAYGIAIPNILATALTSYSDRLGTAGAILGFLYYALLGIGLVLASISQNLGSVLICSSTLTFIILQLSKK